MRALLVVLLLAATASAQPKRTVDRVKKEASEAFKAGLAADEANDLPTALGRYQAAFAISPHPATAYNIADVLRRQGKLTGAIHYFEVFLSLSPPAAEAKAAQALIDKLAATPAVLLLSSSPPSDARSVNLAAAYVIVDGKIIKRAGEPAGFDPQTNAPQVELAVPAGEHRVDVVTPLSYGSVMCQLRPGERTQCQITMEPREDGSLVVSASDQRGALRLMLDANTRVGLQRIPIKPGRHRYLVRDNRHECPALTVDVPGGGDVQYVFLHTTSNDYSMHCRGYRATQHRLTFD